MTVSRIVYFIYMRRGPWSDSNYFGTLCHLMDTINCAEFISIGQRDMRVSNYSLALSLSLYSDPEKVSADFQHIYVLSEIPWVEILLTNDDWRRPNCCGCNLLLWHMATFFCRKWFVMCVLVCICSRTTMRLSVYSQFYCINIHMCYESNVLL